MDPSRLHAALAGNLTLQPTEVAALQQDTAKLDQTIASLMARRERYQALLSPLRRGRIPPEILGEIFSRALPDSGRSNIKIRGQLRDICLVCKTWRQVALSWPPLWCHLGTFQLKKGVPNFNLASVWSRRSGNLPKRLALEDWGHDGGQGQGGRSGCPLTTLSLAATLAQVTSIGELSISCHGIQCIEALFNNMELSLPANSRPWDRSLRTLDLQISEECWTPSVDSPKLDILSHLPGSLTDLKLDLPCFLDVVHTPHPLSSSSVVNLELTMSSWPTHWILYSAESCPNLQSLIIDLADIDADLVTVVPGYPAKQAYKFPRLRELRFQKMPDRYTSTRILRLLQTPLLNDLDLSFDSEQSNLASDMRQNPLFEDFGEDMRAFMRKSGCAQTLRHAQIRAVCLPWVTLEAVLESLYPVTHLTLDCVWSYGTGEPWPAWPHTLLPNLQILELLGMDGTFDDHCITSFVKGRAESGVGLKEVKVTMFGKGDPGVRGLEVELMNP